MPPIAVRITIAGRFGPVLETAVSDLDAEVAPRHTVVRVGSGSLPDVLRLLKELDRREVEFDRIVRSSG